MGSQLSSRVASGGFANRTAKKDIYVKNNFSNPN